MKLVYDKKTGQVVEQQPPAPSPAACTKFDKPSKKPLRGGRSKRELNRSGYLNHRSDAAGVDPSDAEKATKHAASVGHSNITFDKTTGEAVMRNGSLHEWKSYLKKIGMHDKGSYTKTKGVRA